MVPAPLPFNPLSQGLKYLAGSEVIFVVKTFVLDVVDEDNYHKIVLLRIISAIFFKSKSLNYMKN